MKGKNEIALQIDVICYFYFILLVDEIKKEECFLFSFV